MLNHLQHPNFLAVSITAIFAFVHNYNLQCIYCLSPLSNHHCNPHCFTFPTQPFFHSFSQQSLLAFNSLRGGAGSRVSA